VGKHVIKVKLSEEGIDQAIKELEMYQKDVEAKCDLLRQRIAERLASESQNGFNGAVVEDIVKYGSPRFADVKVTIDSRENVTVVIANGEDAVWVEFGAGVFHNGSAGSSPNPLGASMSPPMIIGGYGKGNGKKRAWGFYDEDHTLKITRGTPAAMPMMRAITTVCNELPSIAREVFG
jgi:hypothetical protein